MPRVPGLTCYTATGRTAWPAEYHVKLAGQIGDMIGKCCGHRQSPDCDSIDTFIIRRLQLYMTLDEPRVAPFKELIGSLLARVEELRKLPPCWSHWDINSVNIMVTDDGNVSGILDWEEAYWMPFGMNACRLPDLAAYNQLGVLSKKPYSDDMEIAFWKSLFQAAPKGVRTLLKEIQLAMDIGRVITTFFDASSPPPPAHVGVLTDSMNWYRVPEDLSILVSALPFEPPAVLTSLVQHLDNDQYPPHVLQKFPAKIGASYSLKMGGAGRLFPKGSRVEFCRDEGMIN
jgi:hypothetical protein